MSEAPEPYADYERAVQAAATRLEEMFRSGSLDERQIVELVLEAAMPHLEAICRSSSVPSASGSSAISAAAGTNVAVEMSSEHSDGEQMMPDSADTVRPPSPDFTRRFVALATALGFQADHFFDLLDSYGLRVVDALEPQPVRREG